MSKTKWIAAILIALIVVLFIIYVFKDYKPETEAPIDSKPIPEDVVVDEAPLKQLTLFAEKTGTSPKNIVIKGGQTAKIWFQALDEGPTGNGYTLRIPAFDISINAKMGEPGEVTYKPTFYGSFRYYVDGTGDGGGMVIVKES